jgi:hypothetical protein
MKVLFLMLFTLTVITICLFAVWPSIDRFRHRTPPAAAPAGATPAVKPESLEGVLVVKLMGGEISRGQYLKAVEGLAARDDERHPLTVPPESGPADA